MKAILFDFDGVIVDSMKLHAKSWQSTFKMHGMAIEENTVYSYEGMPSLEIATKLLEMVNKVPNISLVQQLVACKQKHYATYPKPEVYGLVPNIINLVKSKGIKVGLVSGGSIDVIKRDILPLRLENMDTVISGNDVSKGKPDPEPYLIAAERLGTKISECIVVENAPLGIIAAKSAGMKCIGIATTLDASFLNNADVVVNDHAELLEKLLAVIEPPPVTGQLWCRNPPFSQ